MSSGRHFSKFSRANCISSPTQHSHLFGRLAHNSLLSISFSLNMIFNHHYIAFTQWVYMHYIVPLVNYVIANTITTRHAYVILSQSVICLHQMNNCLPHAEWLHIWAKTLFQFIYIVKCFVYHAFISLMTRCSLTMPFLYYILHDICYV